MIMPQSDPDSRRNFKISSGKFLNSRPAGLLDTGRIYAYLVLRSAGVRIILILLYNAKYG